MLRTSPLLLTLAIALALPANHAAQAAGEPSPAAQVAAGERRVYIVVFEEPAIADFQGFSGADKQRPPLRATAASATGARRLDPRSEAVVAYRDYLGDLRRTRLDDAAARLGRPLQPQFVYDFALNGLALELTAAEAAALAAQPGVKRVQPEFVHRPMTDRGPAWIQAPQVWDGTATGTPRRGEGVVVGIIDTGVRATHASFSAVSALDAYAHANPRGVFYGNAGVGSTTAPKNNKLIGIWDFTTGTGDNEANDGGDVDSHGTHVAATAAGNPVDFTAGSYSARMAGVAPRANLVSYKACEMESNCRGAWTLAAINQAIADQVDVINYSIGGDVYDPWTRFGTAPADDAAEAMLNARAAGIVVAVAAGNEGPQPSTLTSPANAPWVLGVAAVSHDRAVINTLVDLTGGGTVPGGGSLAGSGNSNLGAGTALVPIVRDPAYPFCAAGSNPGASPPTGATAPPTWNAGTFAGRIVVCERATVNSVGYARVEMAYNVQQAGGVGMILLNQDSDGLSTVADSYVIPMVHLSSTDSQAMRAWLGSGSGHAGRLAGSSTQTAPSFGDRLASFSGRGPVVPMGVLKPDVAAPGVSIYAAGTSADNAVSVKGGTSMASPHVAGAAALLRSINPALTPSQIQSALVMTARDAVLLPSAAPATPHDQGAGRIDVARAARAGLYLEASANEFRAARSGTAHTLNLPTIASQRCFETCTLSRRFRLMPGVASGQYAVSIDMPAGASATPSATTLSLSGADTATLDLSFDVGALPNQWVRGRLNLTNISGDGRPDLQLPITVFSDPFQTGVAPSEITRNIVLERGHFPVNLGGLVAMPDARFIASGLAEPITVSQSLGQDPTFDPYDGLTDFVIQPHHVRYLGTVPASGPDGAVEHRVRAVITSTAPDLQLFIGVDSNGDGLPSLAEERCRATGPTSAEACDFTLRSGPAPQSYWVLVQGFNTGGAQHAVNAESSAVPLSAGASRALVATGPGRTSSGQGFQIRLVYDAPDLLAGQRRVGYVMVQSRDGNTIANIPVSLNRSGAGVAPFALADNVGRRVTLPAGAAHDRLFFDVPPHATEVVFGTQSAANMDLYVARVPHASTADSGIAAAPARAQANASATTAGGDETITLSGAVLSPGRWYVTPVNTSAAAADVTVTARVTARGPRPGFRAGHYFNPARSGHGAFIDFAGPAGNPDQWLMVWYTYLEDGTPTWYYVQGSAPDANGIFRGDLQRVVWNGSGTHASDVGDVSLTELGAESISFSYNAEGTSGSETLSRLGGSGCANFNGQPLDVSGHWFSPSLSGFGYSYQVTGGASPQEIFVPYVYDGNGFPRWVYGQRAFDGGGSAIPLQWFLGFCPTCSPFALVPTAAGSGTRSLLTNGVGAMSTDLVFTDGLSGAWAQSRPVALLSQPKSCE